MVVVPWWIEFAAYVNPVVVTTFACSLENQLIGIDIVHEPGKTLAKLFLVGTVDVI